MLSQGSTVILKSLWAPVYAFFAMQKFKWALILMVVAGLKTTCMQSAVQSDENGLKSFP